MSDSPEVVRASERIIVAFGVMPGDDFLSLSHDPICNHDVWIQAARALSAAGLLRTEADRLNARLADAYMVWSRGGVDYKSRAWNAAKLDAAWRAIVDSRKLQWTVVYPTPNATRACGYGVLDAHEGNAVYAPGNGWSQDQAEAVAYALNSMEAK